MSESVFGLFLPMAYSVPNPLTEAMTPLSSITLVRNADVVFMELTVERERFCKKRHLRSWVCPNKRTHCVARIVCNCVCSLEFVSAHIKGVIKLHGVVNLLKMRWWLCHFCHKGVCFVRHSRVDTKRKHIGAVIGTVERLKVIAVVKQPHSLPLSN